MKNEFKMLPINEIVIEKRLRMPEPEDIETMVASLQLDGQIYPVLLNNNGCLIDGLTRIRAAEALGWSEILVQFQKEEIEK